MSTPTVIEIQKPLEPVTADPFVADLDARPREKPDGRPSS